MTSSNGINVLQTHIKRLGNKNKDGFYVVKFGVLFKDETCQNEIQTLVSILRSAKKKKIVKYEGEMLFQGSDDNVDVILIAGVDADANKQKTKTKTKTETEAKTEDTSISNTNNVSFRITYFCFGGRAVCLRLAAVLGGLAFEDEFVGFDEVKNSQESGTRRWAGVPELTIMGADGEPVTTIGQSTACLRYIGKLTGAYPANGIAAAWCDEIMDSVEDMYGLLDPSNLQRNKNKRKKMREALLTAPGKYGFSYWLDKFEKRLQENESRGNTNGYFVGNDITVADLKFYSIISFITLGLVANVPSDLLTKYEKCSRVMDNINSHPVLKNYLKQFRKRAKQFRGKGIGKCLRNDGKFCPGSL